MSDMSRCPHGDAVGYCDICSPNWEQDLFNAGVQDTIYAAGLKRGRSEIESELSASQVREAELREKLEAAEARITSLQQGENEDLTAAKRENAELRKLLEANVPEHWQDKAKQIVSNVDLNNRTEKGGQAILLLRIMLSQPPKEPTP